jgi:hypothetical protein
LRADLASGYVCRLLNYMDRRGYTQCVPRYGATNGRPRPLLGLTSGYIQRAADVFPKQGSKAPWVLRQNYLLDLLSLHFGAVDDGTLVFSTGGRRLAPSAPAPPGARPAAASP